MSLNIQDNPITLSLEKQIKIESQIPIPIITKPEPIITKPAPIITKPEPIITKPEPIITKQEPIITKQEPTINPINKEDDTKKDQ